VSELIARTGVGAATILPVRHEAIAVRKVVCRKRLRVEGFHFKTIICQDRLRADVKKIEGKACLFSAPWS
jgi:hypothetical protein